MGCITLRGWCFTLLLSTVSVFANDNLSCSNLSLLKANPTISFEGIEEVDVHAKGPQFERLKAIQTDKIESYAKQHGFQPLEKHHKLTIPEKLLRGTACVVLDVKEPRQGEAGSVRLKAGYIERVANHFVIDVDEPRLPRHDGLVIVDSDGNKTLLDNSDKADRVFINPQQRTSVKDNASIPLEELLKEPGWIPVSAETMAEHGRDGTWLVGKEVAGYQSVGGGQGKEPQKHEVRGVIRANTPFQKWQGWMSGAHFSQVTGEGPYIAVEIINSQGTTYEHPLSAPGKYYVRELNP